MMPWSWTPGAILYANASGALSTTPTEFPVALALSATEIYIFGDSAHSHAIVTLLNSGGLHILDTDGSHTLNILVGSDLSATRTLTITTGDADRVITLSGNPTLGDWFDQSVKTTADVAHATIASRKAQDTDFDTDEVLATGIGTSYGLLIIKNDRRYIGRLSPAKPIPRHGQCGRSFLNHKGQRRHLQRLLGNRSIQGAEQGGR